MTRSNRILNRVLLALLGLALLAGAAYLGARSTEVSTILGWQSPELPEVTPTGWMIVAGAAVLLAILSLAWALTRGRGATDVVRDRDGLRIDRGVAGDLLRETLGAHPEVASLAVRSYRVRGRVALLLQVSVVSGARLPRVISAARTAVEELDRQLEEQVPVALHLTTGSRVIPTRVRRVD